MAEIMIDALDLDEDMEFDQENEVNTGSADVIITSSVKMYLREIGRYNLLSREEEIKLAVVAEDVECILARLGLGRSLLHAQQR